MQEHEIRDHATSEVIGHFKGHVPRVGDIVWHTEKGTRQPAFRVAQVAWWTDDNLPSKACVYVVLVRQENTPPV